MKKTYIVPQSLVVFMQQHTPLATSIDEGVDGNSDFYYGGGNSGDTEGRAKTYHSIWDDEW